MAPVPMMLSDLKVTYLLQAFSKMIFIQFCST